MATKTFAQLAKERRAKAAKELAAKNKKAQERKSNIGKSGYDKYGVKTQAGKKADAEAAAKKKKADAAVKKRVEETRARDKAIADAAKQKKQVDKIKKTISSGPVVDQTKAKTTAQTQANKGSSQEKQQNIKQGKIARGTGLGGSINFSKFTSQTSGGANAPKLKKMNITGEKGEHAGKLSTGAKSAPKADAVKDTPETPQEYKQTRADKRKLRRKARKQARADKAQSAYEASQKNKSAYTKKQAERLKKRAEKKKGIAAGTRKTGLGTALTKLGRGALGVVGAYGGEFSGLKKGGTKGSAWKTAAHVKRKKDKK